LSTAMPSRGLFLAACVYLLFSVFICGCDCACTNDTDCFLHGECIQSQCLCDFGWTGVNCTQLNLMPAPVPGAYGYSPNVSSWGGLPIYVDGLFHLYVTEMVFGCGLCEWGYNSEIVHAVSKTLFGPYRFVDVAVPLWSHNPEVVIDNSTGTPTYIIYHIGDADGGTPKICNTSSLSHHRQERQEGIIPEAGLLHHSESPYGPWIPLTPHGLQGGCNNPAPLIYSNGSVLLICTWFALSAPSFRGPYKPFPFNFTGNAGNGTWEDPFIWLDKRGHYHMLSHVWEGTGKLYAVRVGGQAYSLDGMLWVQTDQVPYTNMVNHTDGEVSAYSTRERPKLYFDPISREPVALFNGVGGVPGGDKDTCGIDWTYTLVQPVGDAQL